MTPLLFCLSLGACLTANDGIQFRLQSEHATRVDVCLFEQALNENEKACFELSKTAQWSRTISQDELKALGLTAPLFYGYRAWGPNWTYDSNWKPGSSAGFHSDVDDQGNRFNPNKILLDPYTVEVSHGLENVSDITVFNSGAVNRDRDSAKFAPKAVITFEKAAGFKNAKPAHAFKDEVIYEVHAKGLTANDPDVPLFYRGTYKGAAMKAAYLRKLGVTAVEFLPVHQMTNTLGNYWGYMPLAYFAPQRSYAFDKSPGGPIKEFREMVDTFHKHGLKVYADVVYNHTGEGGLWDNDINVTQLVSYRGLDNSSYYNLARHPAHYMDHTGCGNDLDASQPLVRNLIIDSLKYWKDELGLDGFRFDLASVLGNSAGAGPFYFDANDPNNVLQRARFELPARPAGGGAGVDLIAEPWALGTGTYQQGHFPNGWAEWNGGAYRDTVRAFFNKRNVENVSLGEIAGALSGSPNLFEANGRKPWHSVNFITAHDGFTLRDLFSYNSKNNNQPFPFGPSDGGSDNNRSWDQGGDPKQQRQMVRTSFVSLLTSVGTPMIVGGDEFYRTLRGNNNPYNLDTVANHLPWPELQNESKLVEFVSHLLSLRSTIEGLRPSEFFLGRDNNSNGVKDLSWLDANGAELRDRDFAQTTGFLAYRIDNSEFDSKSEIHSVLIATNADFQGTKFHLPVNKRGMSWYRSVDTDEWFESKGSFSPIGSEPRMNQDYYIHPRSAVIFLEKSTR